MTSQSVKEETAMASDWSGKLVIKAKLGDDVRIIPIHNEDITYDELILMMQRVYRGTLTSSDDIAIKYQDDDGDLITMFDCADLSYALHNSKVLKITLFPAIKTKPLLTEDGVAIRNELLEIKQRVSRLLDCLEADKRISDAIVEAANSHQATGRSSAVPAVMNEGKEFDPLSNGPSQLNGLPQTGAVGSNSSRRGSSDSHTGGGYAHPLPKPAPSPVPTPQHQQQLQQQQQQQPLPQQQQFQQPPPPLQQPQSFSPQHQPPLQQQQQPPQQQQQQQASYPPQPPNPSKAPSQPPNTPAYPQTTYQTNAYPQNPPPPSAAASAPYNNQPPPNNSYYPSNPAYPTNSVPSYQNPQPVQTGIQGGQYNPYGQYKAPQGSPGYQQPLPPPQQQQPPQQQLPQQPPSLQQQPPQQQPFYLQAGQPASYPPGGNPYSRGAAARTIGPK